MSGSHWNAPNAFDGGQERVPYVNPSDSEFTNDVVIICYNVSSYNGY